LATLLPAKIGWQHCFWKNRLAALFREKKYVGNTASRKTKKQLGLQHYIT
jgi:hypothetical protein